MTNSDWKKFITAGNALFTIGNAQTNNWFTFKVKKLQDNDRIVPLYFVSVLNGPDNYANYKYIGSIFGEKFTATKKGISSEAQSFKVFNWIFNRINDPKPLPEFIELHHEGKCCRCGRRLTVPESIKNGIGPECAEKIF